MRAKFSRFLFGEITRALNSRRQNLVHVLRPVYAFYVRLNPTLGLALGANFLFFSIFVYGAVAWPPAPAVFAGLFVVQLALVILLFTVLHDAAHRVASPRRALNEALLYSCWPIFMNSPHLFRRIHITHHARVNDPTDPDHFTQAPTLAGRWARSFVLVFYYYAWCVRESRLFREDRVHVVLSPLSSVLIGAMGWALGRFWLFAGLWILPSFVGIGILAYLNTAWPHHPGQDRTRHGATRILYVPWWLQCLMGHQNLHLLHHLNPTVPWYKYREYWRQHGADILAKGGRASRLWNKKETY
jgi:beta-carotene hydroxylase